MLARGITLSRKGRGRLRYDVATEVIDGAVTVTTLVHRPLDVIALDAPQLVVTAVTVDGAPATFEQTDSELLVRPATPVGPGAAGRRRRHATATTATNVVAGFGLGSGWFPVDGGSYVLNEPDGARRWLPSNDHPSDKATWRFERDGRRRTDGGRQRRARRAASGRRRHDVGLGAATSRWRRTSCSC